MDWTILYLGLVYVFVVSSTIPTFELFMFLLGVVPKDNAFISYYVVHTVPLYPDFNGANFTAILDVEAERENELNSSYNRHLIVFIIFFIVVLLQGAIFFARKVKDRKLLIIPLVLAAITIICILMYLVCLYFFAYSFEYTTNEEIQLKVFDLILQAFGEEI